MCDLPTMEISRIELLCNSELEPHVRRRHKNSSMHGCLAWTKKFRSSVPCVPAQHITETWPYTFHPTSHHWCPLQKVRHGPHWATTKVCLGSWVQISWGGQDLHMPSVLFIIWGTPQANSGFTPFELLFGQWTSDLWDMAQEHWKEQASLFCPLIEYVQDM